MEWWQIFALTAIVAIIGVAGEVWLRLAPQRERQKEERQKAKATVKIELQESLIHKANAYKPVKLGELQKIIKSPYISRNLCAKLTDIASLGKEYDDWRHESWQVVNTEISRMNEDSQYKDLNESLRAIVGGGLREAFSGYDGHYSEPTYKAVYEGKLTFDLARDSFSERRWEQSATVKAGLFGKKKITLTDVLGGAQFHRFIEELQQLQKRKCFNMLREVRKILIENAQAISKEV
jgi:hypothetical protein